MGYRVPEGENSYPEAQNIILCCCNLKHGSLPEPLTVCVCGGGGVAVHACMEGEGWCSVRKRERKETGSAASESEE